MKFLDNIYNMENNQTIKASELRIDNLVNYLGKNIVCNAQTIYAISLVVQPSVMYLPIPLTEGWLLRMGFKPGFGNYLLKTNRGIIVIEEDLAEISFSGMQRGFDAPCKYVHQLQNLYFALTNQELEIKES